MRKLYLTPENISWAIAILFNLISWLLLYFFISAANFPFIIKYTVGSSADFWGTRLNLFLVPLLGLIILGLNAILSWVVRGRERDAQWLLLGTGVFCQLLVLLYALATIYVNTY